MLTHAASPPALARVVVLGARGFVGRHIVERLLHGGLLCAGLSSSDIDLTVPDSVDRLRVLLRADDAVVFVSALTPDRGRDSATLMRNLAMAQHVSTALAAVPCAHVVYIGSDAVYDDAATLIRESSCCQPTSLHGVMHYARERMLIEAVAGRVPMAMLRPSLLYGPGDTHNAYGPNRFVRTALSEGRIMLFGEGEEQRDHVFVEDLAQLVELVLRSRSSGVLNVATGTSLSFRAVAEAVARLVPQAVQIQGSPRRTPISHRHFDVTACIAAFPAFRWTPLSTGLRAALAATAGHA